MTSTRTRRLRPVVRPSRAGFITGFVVSGTTVAVLVVAVVALFQLDDRDLDGMQPLPSTAPVVAEESEDGSDLGGAAGEPGSEPLPLVTYELFLARDPFEPVVPELEPEPEAAPELGPQPSPDPTDPSAPGSVPQPGDPVAPGAGSTVGGSCNSGQEVVCDGRVFTVVEVLEENGEYIAVLEVDTMRYRVRAGDLVLDRYEVLTVSPDEVRLLVGDRVVRVQVGDNVLK